MDQARPRSRKRCQLVLSAATRYTPDGEGDCRQGNSVAAVPSNEAEIRVKARCLQRALLLLCLTLLAVFGGTAIAGALWCSCFVQLSVAKGQTESWYLLLFASSPYQPPPGLNQSNFFPPPHPTTSSLAFYLTKASNTSIKPSCSPSLASQLTRGASEVLSN